MACPRHRARTGRLLLGGWVGGGPGGGGHSEWLPNAKRSYGAEALNAKI